MKSQKAKEFIDRCMAHLTVEMSDHAKWQLRAAMSHTAELAEQEAEERMRDKAIEAFCKDCPIYSIQTSNGKLPRLQCIKRIQTKTERGMKFTTHCFVRVEDAEKRKDVIEWCMHIGYEYIYPQKKRD